MHIIEKLPQTIGLCPIVKFRSYTRKLDPKTFDGHIQPKNAAKIAVLVLFKFSEIFIFAVKHFLFIHFLLKHYFEKFNRFPFCL